MNFDNKVTIDGMLKDNMIFKSTFLFSYIVETFGSFTGQS